MKEQYEGQVALLIDVLPFVAQADVFALKGGTAINFFHLDCPRLSVDIDLHYLPLNNREQALADIKANMETIAAGIENAYTDTQVRVDGRTCNAVVARRGTQIKIEPNTIIRGKLLPIENMRLSPYLEEKYGRTLSFPCVAKHELYAGKLCAALQRQHPRDLFDVLLFLRENDLSVEFMDAFLVYLISQGKPIYEELNPNIKDVEALYHNQFMGMPAEKVALEHLTGVQTSLSGQVLAALGDRHRQFLLGFKQGSPDWSLLPFNGVKDLPAVRWKQINLDKMDSPKRQQAIVRLQQLFAANPFNPEHTGMTIEKEGSNLLSPQDQLAEEIAAALVASGLVDAARKKQIGQQIAAGQLKREDWSLMVEVAQKPGEKGGATDA